MPETQSTPKELLIQRVHGDSSAAALCLNILTEGIPASELLPGERLRRLLSGDEYRLYSLSPDGEIAGAAILYLPAGKSFALLDYMAVRRGRRGHGLGSVLFRRLVEETKSVRPHAEWLFFEVDDDRVGSDESRHLNARRIAFYRRLGARLVANFPYRFPSPSATPVPMRLMVLSLREGCEPSREALLDAVEHVFSQVHGREKGDSIIQWIRREAPAALAFG